MKESYWGYWLILLGILVVVVLLLVQSYTTTNTQDYYLLKETTEAAMADAVDYAYYETHDGELRINKELFMESFIKRFAENASLSSEYKISFYDIYEAPPKVSVKITSKSKSFSIKGDAENLTSVSKLSSVLQINMKKTSTEGGSK